MLALIGDKIREKLLGAGTRLFTLILRASAELSLFRWDIAGFPKTRKISDSVAHDG
jgi:hypothetical protein